MARSSIRTATAQKARPSVSDRRRERGSVLALVPAGLLVLMLLAAIAVDSSVAYLGRRELAAAADAAANDAVTYGLDEARFRETGAFALDPVRAEEAVRRALLARHSDVVDRAVLDVQTDAETGIRHRDAAVHDRAGIRASGTRRTGRGECRGPGDRRRARGRLAQQLRVQPAGARDATVAGAGGARPRSGFADFREGDRWLQ